MKAELDNVAIFMLKWLTMVIHFDSVPHYSQFQDIPAIEWQSSGCGVASLAMALEFYKPKMGRVSVTNLILQALEFGAYQTNVGWKHKELAALAGLYGLTGKNYDLSELDNRSAFEQFKSVLADGPVIVSIHNKFNSKNTLGHLVVVTGIENDVVFYHDPAGNQKEKAISAGVFLGGWKKRFIVVRETTGGNSDYLSP